MTDELTALVNEMSQAWPGVTPQLGDVTNAGDSETNYYRIGNRRPPYVQNPINTSIL